MSWTTAVDDLRTMLSDGPTDRYNSRKKCFGQVDGVNTTFRTFEFRRITDFTSATGSAAPLGVYISGTRVDPSVISTDYPDTGEFVIGATGSIPSGGDWVEASYYNQWFIDTELEQFLKQAGNWISGNDDYTAIPSGLIPCALKYAAAEAYQKMAQRWRTWLSEMYRVEDQPKEQGAGPVESFINMSKEFREQAEKCRENFYKTRQGRSLQPLFGSVLGNVKKVTTR